MVHRKTAQIQDLDAKKIGKPCIVFFSNTKCFMGFLVLIFKITYLRDRQEE